MQQAIVNLVTTVERDRPFLPAGVDIEQYVAKLLRHATILSFIEEGELKGVLAFYCNDPAAKASFFSMLAVSPHDRRRGIGAWLLQMGLDYVRRRGFQAVEGRVYESSPESLAMCEGLGFSKADAEPGVYTVTKVLP